MREYNYTVFESGHGVFDGFAQAPNVGTIAPSFELEDLNSGESVDLRSLWRRQSVVIEFGSYS